MNNMDEPRIFSQLPSTRKISSLKSLNKFIQQIDDIYDPDTQTILNTITRMICTKLSTEDQNWSWTIEDYRIFRNTFSKITKTNIKFIENSIQKSLELSKLEMTNELERFIQECSWYREQINKGEEIPHSNQKQIRWIKAIDCLEIIREILSHMNQTISQFANDIIQKYTSENINDILRKIEDKDIMKEYVEKFEEQYGFIKKYPTFADIYILMSEKFFIELEKRIERLYNLEQNKKARQISVYYRANHQDQKAALSERSKAYTTRKKNRVPISQSSQ